MTWSAAALMAQGPQYLVVPTPYVSNDAVSYEWIAGASRDLRQQTLIGASHLTALVGKSLTAIELRRTAADETYQGGSANLTVTMSISPTSTLDCSATFAANPGTPSIQVFAGAVNLPTSAPVVGPTVAWSAANVVRIPLQTPFLYLGGTLCVDIVGQPLAGQNADWWMADAEFEDIAGTVTDLGGGCGAYGGPQHQWSSIEERSLLPGAYARFFAYGSPFGFGVAAFGTKSPAGIPLAALGFNAGPACYLFLSTLDAAMVSVFEPDPDPNLISRGGRADISFKLPSSSTVLGLTFTTQWLDWSQMATSNALEWTVASALPTLDMALVEGHPQAATGEVSVHLAHVLRFEYQ
jgi:hypothetical protein